MKKIKVNKTLVLTEELQNTDEVEEETELTLETNAARTKKVQIQKKNLTEKHGLKPIIKKKPLEKGRQLRNTGNPDIPPQYPSNQELPVDDEDHDEDYVMENEQDVLYTPKPSVIDKEFEQLNKPDTIYEDAAMNRYVTEDEHVDNIMTPVPLVEQTKGEQQNEIDEGEYNHGNPKSSHFQGKIRRHRQSAFHMKDKTPLFENLDTRMSLNITASELYSIAPDYLSHVHKKTKTRLVLPNDNILTVNVNQSKLQEQDDLNATESNISWIDDSGDENDSDQVRESPILHSFNTLVKQSDPTISQPLIEFDVGLGNKTLKAKYDPGSNSSLIGRETATELGLKIEPFEATVVGINPGEQSIKGLIRTTIEINCHKLGITLLVHDTMERDTVLIGRAFQESHCFSIGYIDCHNRQNMIFKSGGRLHNFKMFNDEVVVEDDEGEISETIRELLEQPLQQSILTEKQKDYFINKLQPIKEVFQSPTGKPGRLKHFPPVRIHAKEHAPWRLKTIPLGDKKNIAVEILEKMIAEEQLEFAPTSAYRNPWFLLKKSSGGFRFLIDLRVLNSFVELEAGHPKDVREIILNISGRKYLTTLDISNAYFQLELDERDRDITAFVTPIGVLRFKVMPQGFKNLVSFFTNVLTKILREISTFTESFLDDIAILGPDAGLSVDDDTEMIKHLDNVVATLLLLHKHGLKINAEKLQIAMKEADFLGYRVDSTGATLLRKRVSAFREFPIPNTLPKLERFLGMTNYYRHLIPAYSEITSPLHKKVATTRKEQKRSLNLNEKEIKHFEYLKRCLVKEPIVVPLKKEHEVKLYTDASSLSWAGVLEATDNNGNAVVIDCVSGSFTNAQINYSIYEKEFSAICYSLEKLEMHILNYDKVIKVYCDNKAVVTLLNGSFTNGHLMNRVARWLSFLRNYHLEVAHIDGKVNLVADCLSRIEDPTSTPLLSINLTEDMEHFKSRMEINTNLTQISENDPKYGRFSLLGIRNYLTTAQIPQIYNNNNKIRRNFISKAQEFYLQDGTMYKRGAKGHFARQVIIDKAELERILRMTHEDRGHMKLQNLFQYINLMFFVPHLYVILQDYISSCHTCQIYDGNNTGRDPLYLNLPGGLFDKIVCDSVFIDDAWLVVARDEFSNWAEATVMTTLDGSKIADFIYREFICRFGQFRQLHSDNGSEWKNLFTSRLLEHYNIQLNFLIQFHPQGNGVVERNHVGLVNFLKKLPKNLNWKDYIDAALRVDRNTIKSTTGMSPHYLVYGYCGHSDLSLLYANPPENKNYTEEELFKFRFKQLQYREVQYNSAAKTAEIQRLRAKEYFDAKHEIDTPVEVGDLVLIWDRPHKNPMGAKMKKMKPKWSGPFRIKSKGDRIYRLEDLDGTELKRPFAREMMKLYIQRK